MLFVSWGRGGVGAALVRGERMPADKDGYVKAARDLLQNMEHTAETFVPLLDKMILPKLSAEFVQQHLIIDLCLNDKDFPDELWKVVLSRLEGLVRRNDAAGLALTVSSGELSDATTTSQCATTSRRCTIPSRCRSSARAPPTPTRGRASSTPQQRRRSWTPKSTSSACPAS